MEVLIKKKKKEVREEIYAFRKNKEEELFKFCLEHGGHSFSKWEKIWVDMFFEEYSHFRLSRLCRFCGFHELKEIEKGVKNDTSS